MSIRIPRMERQQSISAGSGAAFIRAPRGSGLEGIASDLDGLAQGMLRDQAREQEIAERELAQDDERTAALDATSVASDMRNSWTERLETMATEAPDGAPGFGRSVVDAFDSEMEKRLANADKIAAPFLRARMLELRGQVSKKALEIQSARGAAKRLGSLNNTMNKNANAVRSDFGLLDSVIGETTGAIEASAISADLKRGFTEDARAALTVSALQGLATRNPARAKELLDAGDYDGVLKPPQKDALLKASEAEIRRRQAEADRKAREAQAEARAALNTDLKDELAKIELTGQGIGRVDNDRLVRVLGAKDAAIVQEAIEDTKSHYIDRQTIAFNTPQQDAELLARTGDVGDYNVDRESKQNLSIARAIEAKRKALAKDPVGYIVSLSPEARQVITQGDDPLGESTQNRSVIDYLDQLQGQLGIREADRRILSDAAAKGAVANIQSAGLEGMADAIEQSAVRYGDHWPRVYGELVDAGLPAGTRMVAQVEDPQGRVDLVEAQKVGRVALRKDIKDAAAIDVEIKAALEDFDATLRYVPGGLSHVIEHREAAQTLAYHYVGKGVDPTTAARRAVDVLVGKYKIYNQATVLARAPKDIDRDPVAYAELVVRNLRPGDLADISGGRGSKLTPAQARAAYADTLARDHRWVTNSKDNGWILLNGAGNPVELANGEAVEFLFDEIPEIVGLTSFGRVLVKNPDGSKSSERTATVTDPRINGGKPTNIPTIFNGIQRSQEDAIERIVNAGGKDPETGAKLDPHNSIDEAVKAAKERSNALGKKNALEDVSPFDQDAVEALTGLTPAVDGFGR